MKKVYLIIILIIFTTSVHAQSNEFNRTILALYDSTENMNIREDFNLIHFNAEMILNYLGMKVKYHDITKGLPDDNDIKNIYGIITWFQDEYMINPMEYCQWAKQQIDDGKKFVILGNIGAYKDYNSKKEMPDKYIYDLIHAIGLDYEGHWTDNPFIVEVLKKDSAMVEFERTLDNEVGNYEMIRSIKKENEIFLSLKRTDIPDSESAVVVTTPIGGFAMEGYVLFIDPLTIDNRRWRINPFSFFEKAFSIKSIPKYDTTTLLGRRIAYSHIDGDGLRNISLIDNKSYSGEIILNEILKKYDFPITVSLIAAEVNPNYYGNKKLSEISQEMFKLPNVEMGVHGFTHPLDWERQLTVFEIKDYSKKTNEKQDEELISESHYGDAAVIHAPRSEFLNKEIKEAADYINKFLAPKEKNVVINQWTGNCEPPAEGIDVANQAGLKNINGGDTLFDRARPSYTRVASLTRQMNSRIQIYTSNSNENIYTNGWLGPFYGFKHVIETFQQTEHPTLIDSVPRRITPMNIYYHFYSGEKHLSLNALKEVYDYVLNQKIAPIFTSEYVSVVEGFLSGKIREIENNVWEFSDYGECRTVRLDQINIFPDLEKSKGILGFNQWEDFLYVHLDSSNNATLHLTHARPVQIYLQEASTVLSNYQINSDEITFSTKGFGENEYIFKNMPPKTKYTALVKSKETKKEKKYNFRSDQKGTLTISIPIQGGVQISIRGK